MANLAVSSQLEQWAFAKSLSRSDRADSAASTQENLLASSKLDLQPEPAPASTEPLLLDRYLSSEEDLSPMEGDFDESDFDGEDATIEVVTAQAVSTTPVTTVRPKSGDMAVLVSYVSAGKPKVVSVPQLQTLKDRPSRSSSLTPAPATAPLPDHVTRRMSTASPEPKSFKDELRRRSVSFGKQSFHDDSSSRFSMVSAFSELPDRSIRSSTPTGSESLRRPSTAKSLKNYTQAARNSFHLLSKSSTQSSASYTHSSPANSSHSFLNSDPFADGTTNAATPTIKTGSGHKRLRSISRSLTLAKIAIRNPNKDVMTPTTPSNEPLTPFSSGPRTPMTPEAPRSAHSNRRKLVARGAAEREAPVELPPTPETSQKPRVKLVPRGASEREPPVSLPPFPDDAPMGTPKESMKFKLKKRKSILGLV